MKRTLTAIICLALLAGCACLAAEAPQASWWKKAPGQKPAVSGTVANVSAGNIAVQTPQGVKPFTVDPRTKVSVAGARAKIADVKAGMPVTVRFGLVKNNVATATHVVVHKPAYKGQITAIEGNRITLKSKQGEFQVIVTQATKIGSHGYVGTLAELRVGYGARAQGTIADNVMTADTIIFEPIVARGAVTAISGATVTVKTIKQLSLSLVASDKTAVMVRPRVGPNVKGTLADVKVGSPVNVGFAPVKDGPSQLLWVEVLTGS